MTDLAIVASILKSVRVSDFYLGCLGDAWNLDGDITIFVTGSIPNFRHTYHCYSCKLSSSGEPFLLLIQAYIEGFYSIKTGLLYRDPNCYLANAHDEEALTRDLHCAFLSIQDSLDYKRNSSLSVLSGSQSHLAHYFWNHLSALWRFMSAAQSRLHGRGIELMVIPNSELFGPLEKILNSFNFITYMPVNENLQTMSNNNVFSPIIFIEPYENLFIPQALCDSIVLLARTLHEQNHTSTYRTYVYGARPYTRRPTNRRDIFLHYLEAVNRFSGPESRIILDITSRLCGKDDSYFPEVDEIKSQVEDLIHIGHSAFPSIRIMPLVSCPIHQTISILYESNFGIYEWGATLTWYSWILRKPVVALAPPSVLEKLKASQNNLQTWGSFFWESDSPSPLLPNSQLADHSWDYEVASRYRLSPEDYTVDISSVQRLIEQAFRRDQRLLGY